MTCPVKPRLHMRCETHTRKGRRGFKVWVIREKYRALYKSKKRSTFNEFASWGWRKFKAQVRLVDALERILK